MITEDARALLETGFVCDSCLGRPFADRSFGLTNVERGRALRTTVALEDDEDFEPTEPADCWVCEGYCGTFDAIADAIVDALEGTAFGTYQVGTQVPPLVEENERLFREDAGLEPDIGESLKREVNREVGRRVGSKTGTEVDFDRPDVLAVVDLEGFDPLEALADGTVTGHAVDVQVNPAFVYGRYRKLERDIPQTEWPCRECGGSGVQLGDDGEEPCDYCGGSGYMYETSVEQAVRPHVVEAMDGDEGTFHGAGREDVDARMLEGGRPFVLEVKRPQTRDPDPAELEREINEVADGVEVEGLRLASYEMVERVKEHDASKQYRADVELDDPIDEDAFEAAIEELDGATLAQETPERVDHRRASLTRERTVYDLEGELRSPTEAEVRLHGEGGLYVKEFVSSDDGRTKPSLAGVLGTEAEVTALDVTGVEGEDEPFEREEYFVDEPRDKS
ncbi:tRNA pseudouridine(54/55) synthase Pus10 [Natronobacterium gregoryi]|uniref:tRNA pseudouridine synthase Pus10 n=2 Tax=Natronobacterium gregoryi TaxID=44930 RepID=L0AEC2_NATGS|nr:tRNA pseudouridine(54/55) synthase Pus10 [Natronobacterium gregoryi]AFZ72253.1 TIGR01213 family protein [Natronobacterium gregoryi SP2]ELY62347.1 pseudouridylate synthase [Natronobacterium gregoryi SP2]PLK20200.1 tRNA pseudouridine(54/55) synthase Pus10 [Natronobacterium gregoryi SP2]SFJ28988.1 tRNA pseudouridine synthase 10 [Natronobacterium gregoryi]